MNAIDHIVGEFAEAWNAGRRPDVAEYLDRVEESQRAELAGQIGLWLEVAPTPDYDEHALAAMAAAPDLVAAFAAADAPLRERLPALRERAGLGVRELAGRVVALFGLDDADRAASYIEQVERDELDETRLSRRLIAALAAVMRVEPDQLLPSRPAPAMGVAFLRADRDAREWSMADIEGLSRLATTPASAPMDELDRLFLGGPEA